MRPVARSLLGAVALAAMLATAAPAGAQGADTQAQTLFAEGRSAMEKGDYPTACARFGASLTLVSRASTLLNLAQCEQHENRLVASSKHWKQGIDLLPPGDERLAISKERAAAVNARLAHVTLQLTGPVPAGTRAELDGANAGLTALQAGTGVDPGRHVIVLFVPGGADLRATIDVVEGETKAVMLAPPVAAAPVVPDQKGSGGGSSTRTVGFVLGGVGVAGFIAAGVTGGMLISKNSGIQTDCPNKVCSAAGRALINSTGPLKVANAVGWGVGLAGLASGVILVVVGGNGKAQTQTAVAPTALPGGAGLWVTRTF